MQIEVTPIKYWEGYSYDAKKKKRNFLNHVFLLFQDLGKIALVLLVGVLICIVDAQRNKLLDDLKLPDLKLDDKKEKNWNLNLNPMVNNGRFGLQSNLDYKKDNWKFGVEHQFQDVPKPFKDYHKFGGSVGYDNGRFSVTGRGHYDNTGNWGAGINLGWRFKRSLPNYRVSSYILY